MDVDEVWMFFPFSFDLGRIRGDVFYESRMHRMESYTTVALLHYVTFPDSE